MRLLQDALRALAGDQVEVVVAGLERPHPYIHRLSEARCAYELVAANLDAARRGFDAVVVGHFQDGGVHELRAALDIPVVGLGETTLIHRIVHEARDNGMALVISSAEIDELLLLCDRFVVLFRGRVVATLSRAEATQARLTHLATEGPR
ncbi:hypothetical protein GCM10009765_43210 [Fodinicola feengrottensis]|uniref:Uncharacterized protein n=1 Tax=Fodinicola feengrottensis TaxID=435914 RepID=A0ABN2HJS1_9ACTN